MPTAGFILAPIKPLPPELPRRLREYGFAAEDRRKTPKRGGVLGILANEGNPRIYFNFDAPAGALEGLRELARDCGGDHFAIFTWNGRLHHWLFRGIENGDPPAVRKCTIALQGGKREGDPVGEIANWFSKSVIQPDMGELERQLAGPQIRISVWFSAFGLEGASDFEELATIWDDLEPVALALLSGEAPDKGALKKVNAALRLLNTEKLPAAPKSKPGQTSALIPGAVESVRAASSSLSSTSKWRSRLAAASFYDPITQGEALDRLTVGIDKKGLGSSASLGRLLGHYPREMVRDPLFLSLAGHEAECWNGHAYVASFHSLAEHAPKAGFTLAIFPTEFEADFRKAHGISPAASTAQNGFSAEAFVDLPGILKVEPAEVITAWFTKKKATGIVLRMRPDGTFDLQTLTKGNADSMPSLPQAHKPDVQLLARAARDLWPRDAFAGLGLADLLAPGPFTPPADDSEPATQEQLSTQTFKMSFLHGSPLLGESYAQLLAKRPELRADEVRRHEDAFVLHFQPRGHEWNCYFSWREDWRGDMTYNSPGDITKYDRLSVQPGDQLMGRDRLIVREHLKNQSGSLDGGGVVELKLTEMDSLFRLTLLENPEVQPEIILGPQGKGLVVPPPFELSERNGVVELALQRGGQPAQLERWLADLGAKLAALPAGTKLGLKTVSALAGYRNGERLLSGTIEAGGIFRITAASPLATAQALTMALEVMASVVRGRVPASESEVTAALAKAREDSRVAGLESIYKDGHLSVVNGNGEALHVLAGYVLNERDGATWRIAQFPSFWQSADSDDDQPEPKIEENLLRLFGAVRNCMVERAAAALDAGADPNGRNVHGNLTPLMELVNQPPGVAPERLAAQFELLLRRGADVNLQDENGVTCLMTAVLRGNDQVVKILLEAGAKPEMASRMGITALTLARRAERKSIISLLGAAGARN